MKHRWIPAFLLFCAIAPAYGQFQLFVVTGTQELPAPGIYDIGKVEPGLTVTTGFRIRNISTKAAYLDLLSVSGSGFSLSHGPNLPVTLAPQQSMEFLVAFESARTGSYSASVDSVGVSVLVTATVPTELTNTVDSETGVGTRALGAATVDFGSVARGSVVTRRVTLSNQTAIPLAVPAISLAGNSAFSIRGPVPSGQILQPVDTAGFDIQFSPAVDGTAGGQLNIGLHNYLLDGMGIEPPLPAPRIAVSLPQTASAQQGNVRINFDAPSRTSGIGSVTISFRSTPNGLADPAVAFAAGGVNATFTVAPGDTAAQFLAGGAISFQTGTTAGTLTITAQLGENTDQQTFLIAPTSVGLSAAQAKRSLGAIEVDLTGFDNTRSAGRLAFTFYDASGNAIGSTINADSTSGFASYFQTSLGGSFVLQAIFPVTGDATQIKSFTASVTNTVGTTSTGKVVF